MLKHIKKLFEYDRQLMGEGYDKALDYINEQIPLEILEFKSGEKFGTWKVPQEWVIRDGWVKHKGKKIIDYKKEPLSVMVYSRPVNKAVDREELKKHLNVYEDEKDNTPYAFNFYERDWGFCVPHRQIYKKLNVCTGCELGAEIEGITDKPTYEDLLEEGEYQVFIDSELKDGTMKVGVHTIKGKTDKEILLLAHLDHPYQANDNLSGVACLLDIAKKLKKPKHTIKLIFCPETIGSIAYAFSQDISKVEAVIALDCVGAGKEIMVQKSYDKFSRLNYAVHLALHEAAISYRKGDFRLSIGSDEYAFNDPRFGIPGILITNWPFREYHSNKDTPEIIDEKLLEQARDITLSTIDIYEKDYVPVRHFKGPLMRSAYGLQAAHPRLNRDTDYLVYDMDGKKWLSEICLPLGMTFSYAHKFLEKLKKHGLISTHTSKRG